MRQQSNAAKKHAAGLAARTRRINEALNAARGIDKTPRRSAKQVAEDQHAKGKATIDDRLGTRAFGDKNYWTGNNSTGGLVDAEDKRRKFVQSSQSETLHAGATAWFDFRLASTKSAGGVAAAPTLNEFITLRGAKGIQVTVQVDRVNRSDERQRTGTCMCRIVS